MTDTNADAGKQSSSDKSVDHPVGYADAAPAQKYIRTFAGDMAILQQGGIPDLEPLVKPEGPALSPKLMPLPADSIPLAATKETPAVEAPLERDEARRTETLARLRARAEVESAQPLLRPDAKPEPLPAESAAVLHTYEADFTDHISDQQASRATIVAAEQDAGSHEETEPEESKVKKIMFIVLGILFLLLGGGGAYYEYTLYTASHMPIVLAPVTAAPIFFNEEEKTSEVGQDLYRTLARSVAQSLPSGSVRLLSSPNATTTRLSLFVVMQLPAPQILLRNIQGTGSMAGVINSGDTQSPFFILSVATYNDTFAGMLQWESTILKDLESLFPAYPVPPPPPPPIVITPPPVATTTVKGKTTKKTTTVVATSTPTVVATSTPARISIPAFHDEIIANHDARIYRDAQERTVMVYGYWNRNTLVIARSSDAFTEILARLATARTP